ncbi:hypothetical protein MHBO_002302 [Bonamia ostreae]|uniref:NADP-dependent oxidoreductase domain-containing protein n=1 Tax=Bonamia ostreae TaxID=126728 RepID=A0ABV2ALV3_9EUKA
MRYKILGRTGLKVSELSFGCSGFGDVYGNVSLETSNDLIAKAVENGINYFDTSPYYGAGRSEEVLGTIFPKFEREKLIISSKCGRSGKLKNDNTIESIFNFSAESLTDSIYNSLNVLNLDYLDIAFLHDIEFEKSKSKICEESIPALQKLKEKGLIRNIGISGFPIEILNDYLVNPSLEIDVVLTYGHYSLQSNLLNNYINEWKDRNVGIICASPFSMGLLTNKKPPKWHPASEKLKKVSEEAHRFCVRNDQNISKTALTKCLKNENIDTVLTGMYTMKELEDAIDVVGNPICPKFVEKVESVFKRAGVYNKMW